MVSESLNPIRLNLWGYFLQVLRRAVFAQGAESVASGSRFLYCQRASPPGLPPLAITKVQNIFNITKYIIIICTLKCERLYIIRVRNANNNIICYYQYLLYICGMDIKTNITAILKKQGRTQKDLFTKLGVSSQSLQYYFRGNITLSKLEEIAAALDVEPWRIIKPIEEGETIEKARPRKETTTAAICPHCGKPLNITIR